MFRGGNVPGGARVPAKNPPSLQSLSGANQSRGEEIAIITGRPRRALHGCAPSPLAVRIDAARRTGGRRMRARPAVHEDALQDFALDRLLQDGNFGKALLDAFDAVAGDENERDTAGRK